jgi:hypothetical protein
MKILHSTASKACPALGIKEKKKKAPSHFFFFSFFFLSFIFSQHAEDRASIRTKLLKSWTPSTWKASLCLAALKKVMPFLPASQHRICYVNLQN